MQSQTSRVRKGAKKGEGDARERVDKKEGCKKGREGEHDGYEPKCV